MTARSYQSLKTKQGFLHREHRSKKGRRKNRPDKVHSYKQRQLTEGKGNKRNLAKRARLIVAKTKSAV